MGRLIDSSSINNCVMMHKSDWGIFATVINNIFDDIVMKCPTVEAIPKDQYEARLKADMVDILEELDFRLSNYQDTDLIRLDIQQKINELKGETK